LAVGQAIKGVIQGVIQGRWFVLRWKDLSDNTTSVVNWLVRCTNWVLFAYTCIIRTLVYAKESTLQTAEKYTTNSRKVHYKQQKSTLQTAEKYTTNSRKVHYKQQKRGTASLFTYSECTLDCNW